MGKYPNSLYQMASARNFLLFAQRLIPVNFVVEAGTCNGEDTLDLFRTLRPKEYFAFEPDPVAYKITKKLYVKNKIMKQIYLYPLALSDTEKYVYLQTPTKFGLGHSNLTESKISSERVKCIRLEQVLKTDTSGGGIVAGCRGTLTSNH